MFVTHSRLSWPWKSFHISHTVFSTAPVKVLKNLNFKKGQKSSVAVISSLPHSAPSERILIPFLFPLLQARTISLFPNWPAVLLTLYLQNPLQQSLKQPIDIYLFPTRNWTMQYITFTTKYETGFCKLGIFHNFANIVNVSTLLETKSPILQGN